MANVLTDIIVAYDRELGVLSFPVWEFLKRYRDLEISNPQLKPQEAAAVAYFGMLAQQPAPTAETGLTHRIWGYTKNKPYEEWEEIEKNASTKMRIPLEYSIGSELVDAQTAYYTNLANLQKWLSYNGLTEGIEKTLNEESRKRQKEMAQLQASEAAAAYASYMKKLNEATTEEARREAAENAGKAEAELNANLQREAELKKELAELEAGILPGAGGGISWPWVIGIGAAAFLILRKGGRK